MKIIIVVDANIILSALLGGKPSIILFDGRYQFTTTKFTIEEVSKYIPKVAKKLMAPEKELFYLLNNLPISVYEKEFYSRKRREAKKMIFHIDKKDVDILALALRLQVYLWSQDKDFEKCGYEKLLKTYDFIK